MSEMLLAARPRARVRPLFLARRWYGALSRPIANHEGIHPWGIDLIFLNALGLVLCVVLIAAAATNNDPLLVGQVTKGGKRPGVAHHLVGDRYFGPIPGQEFIEPAHWIALGHALQDVLQIGEGLHVIELCRGDEGANGGPSLSATIGAGEQMVLTPQRDGSDCALDRIVVELDTAVVQEVTEGRPAGKGVTDRFGEATAARDATKLHLEPGLHRFN